MFIFIVEIFLLVTKIFAKSSNNFEKCCDFNEAITRDNYSSINCVEDNERRVQIINANFQFNGTGNCIDYNIDDKRVYEVTLNDHNQITDYNEFNYKLPYYKCCPINYFYNTKTHSCTKQMQKTNRTLSIHEQVVKIGLPNCRVIIDFINVTLNYTSGSLNLQNHTFEFGQFCMDTDDNLGVNVVRGCKADLGVCENVKCVHKCCPDGQSFVDGSKCVDTYAHGLNLSFSDRITSSADPFAIIHKYDCRIYILKDKIKYFLDPSGVFHAFYNKTNSFLQYNVGDKSYCIEHVKKGQLDDFKFFMCFPDKPIEMKFVVTRWPKILSCVFLLLTMMVYIFLPEMVNIFGRILLCYCASMMSEYLLLLLTYSRFVLDSSDNFCTVFGFLSVFSFLSSFTWLNAMCFDIWWTFGCPKAVFTVQQKRREVRRFLWYSFYGWGLPTALTLLILMLHKIPYTPAFMKPYIGYYECNIEKRPGNYAKLLFFIMPLMIIELTNTVLFAKTVAYCLKVKSDIGRMNSTHLSQKEKKKTYNTDKERFILLIKLSIIMGISFSFEVVSSLFDFDVNPTMKYIESIWDTFNGLQGLFIFLIFVCKPKIYRLIINKLTGRRRKHLSVSSQHTGYTNAPLVSAKTPHKV